MCTIFRDETEDAHGATRTEAQALTDESEQFQEAFEDFRQSDKWGMICMINDVGEFFDIVIRDEDDPEYKCLCGVCWGKQYLTQEQLIIINNKQQVPERQRKALSFGHIFPRTYEFGIHKREEKGFCNMHLDGAIKAHSPEGAESKLRAEYGPYAVITVFY